jgi:hypothetical protein
LAFTDPVFAVPMPLSTQQTKGRGKAKSVTRRTAVSTVPAGTGDIGAPGDMGFIERDGLRRGSVEGPRLLRLAMDTIRVAAPRTVRRAILRAVSEQVGETCNFGILTGSDVVYVDRVEAKWPLGLRFEAGSRVPAHCTAIGKLLLPPMTRKLSRVRSALPCRWSPILAQRSAGLRFQHQKPVFRWMIS